MNSKYTLLAASILSLGLLPLGFQASAQTKPKDKDRIFLGTLSWEDDIEGRKFASTQPSLKEPMGQSELVDLLNSSRFHLDKLRSVSIFKTEDGSEIRFEMRQDSSGEVKTAFFANGRPVALDPEKSQELDEALKKVWIEKTEKPANPPAATQPSDVSVK